MNQHLIERSYELKGELVAHTESPDIVEEFEEMQYEYEQGGPGRREDSILFLDSFIMEHKLEDGRTFLQHFVASHPDLPDDEKQMLLGWQESFYSVFEVLRKDGTFLYAESLLDELTYNITANAGPKVLSQFPVGSFFLSRIAPVEDFWIFSGGQTLFPARESRQAYEMAIKMASHTPKSVFRNPENRAKGFAMQKEDYDQFVAFFGTDTLVVTPKEFPERMKAFMHYKMHEARGEDGKTVEERLAEDGESVHDLPEMETPEWDFKIKTIGVLHDPREGMEMVPDLGYVADVFAKPELAKKEPYRSCLKEYVQAEGLTPLAILRFAQKNPANATKIIRELYGDNTFEWERDGEAFIQQFKPVIDPEKQYPVMLPISGKLSAKLREPEKSVLPPPALGVNAPCPCGSGKKYKKCCGK